MKKEMTEAEMIAEAERMDAMTSAYSEKLRDEMIAYAEANVDKDIQIAFLTMVSLAIANAALEATANGLDKFGPKTLKAEGELAMNMFGEEILPPIMRIAQHFGRGTVIHKQEETLQ